MLSKHATISRKNWKMTAISTHGKKLGIEDICSLLNLFLSNSCFMFNDKFYKQIVIHGCAMDNPVNSPVVANLFVEEIKESAIDLFTLHILFSHFRPRDALMGIFLLFFFISYAYICTCIRRHLKETIPSSSITWSEMGKQNIQAK